MDDDARERRGPVDGRAIEVLLVLEHPDPRAFGGAEAVLRGDEAVGRLVRERCAGRAALRSNDARSHEREAGSKEGTGNQSAHDREAR
jgi:hypothetical protein